MATLVLTAVGSAIGGPIGGAIGAAIGQQVDQLIFAPKSREGARLKELAVQTSSYGSQVPAIFGVMRVAGTVIWATDLVERRAKSGSGKGRPSTVNYTYSVSMAVAISSRPIARIGRIWADGNLLRGSAGDLKTDTQLRVYTGHDDQPLDPLMASAEATGQCPAYRGLAYAMFEDLQLADFGNRIPSLTFELFERDAAVPVSEIFEAASGGQIKGGTVQALSGFALAGAVAREPLSPLLGALPIELGVRNGELVIGDASFPTTAEPAITVVTSENGDRFDISRQTLERAGKIPDTLALRYYDGDRDYQASVQVSQRWASSRNTVQIELPAVLNSAQANQLVCHRHLDLHARRTAWQGDVANMPDRLFPGDYFADQAGKKWQIEQIEHRLGSANISARPAAANIALSGQSATPGRNLPAPDLLIGETRVAVVELPVFGSEDQATPVLAAFAAGTNEGWRRAALSLRAGSSLIDAGVTAMPAIMGTSLGPLAAHTANLIDESTGLRLQLLNGSMQLPERSGSPLDADAPYVWLDGEFIRYGHCEVVEEGIYQLSKLRRGCFRSALSSPSHPGGERVVVIEADTAQLLDVGNLALGNTVTIEALGLGDMQPVSASAIIERLAVTPLAPIHGTATTTADGGVTCHWTRRSRIDLGWGDGVDQIMAEGQEQYLVSLSTDGVAIGQWTTGDPVLSFSAAQWSEFGFSENAAVIAAIRQIGKYGQSDPLLINLV